MNSVTYTYTTLSDLVMQQTAGTQELYFLYDDSSQPYAMVYKSSATAEPLFYYYLLNVQGDVVALMNTSGTIVARYSYDPWGVPTVMNSSGTVMEQSTFIGNINPLRYRGYYYDTETGFYYLQSRYYDPVIGRFISADTFATTDCNGFLSANMFAYCENNPVNRKDPTGEFVNAAIGALVNGAVSALFADSGNRGKAFIQGAISGFIAGAALDLSIATAGAGAAIAIAAIGGAAASATETILGYKMDNKQVNWGTVAIDAAVGAVMNTALGAAGREAGRQVGKTVKTVIKAAHNNSLAGFRTAKGAFHARKSLRTIGNGSFVTGGISTLSRGFSGWLKGIFKIK